MKKVFLRISLAVALSFGVKAGFAQQQNNAQTKSSGQAVEANTGSVVLAKKVMTEAEMMALGDVVAKVTLAPVWFRFKSGSYNVPGNYEFLTNDDMEAITECTTGTEEVCAIKVEPDSSGLLPEPTALTAIQTEISTALGSPGHTANVRLKNL